jgi:molecular chaperone GrpE
MKGKHRKEGVQRDAGEDAVEAAEIAEQPAEPLLPEDAVAPPMAPAAPPADERILRLQADFDNFRKRTQRDRSEIHQRVTEDLMRELLSVLDHLDLALDAAVQHQASGPVIEGVKLVSEQLLGALKKYGLTPVDAAGQDFDPHTHEAIAHVPSAEIPANRVVTQVRRGYLLGARLLRAAQVVVSSGPAPERSGAPPAEG